MSSSESKMRRYFSKRGAAIEITVILALIYFYIWVLMPLHSYGIDIVSYLFVFIVACFFQVFHKLPLKVQGVRFDNFVISLKPVLMVSLVLVCALTVLALLWGKFILRPEILFRSWWFFLWGPIQQFLLQSVLHLRVRSIVDSPFGRVFLSALIFSLVHLPNYYLMIFSFVGGFCWCYLFTKYPNLFTLGFSHTVLDLTLLVIFPPKLLGNLRVGPGFWNR